MEFLQELFLTAFMAVVLSVIVAASIAFSGGNEKAISVVRIEEKRLKVVGVKSKKKVKFMDEVVVRDVDNFDVEEEPSNDLKFLEKFDGIMAKSLEEEISRDEIMKMFDTLDYEGVDEDAEVLVSGCKIVEEIGNVKLVDVEEKACKGIEDKKTGLKREEFDSITGLNLVEDDVSASQKGVEEGGKYCISAVLLGEKFKRKAVEEMNQSTDININTDKGIKESEISAFDGGLNNLSVGENSINHALGGESEVERLRDSALPKNEEAGTLLEESNVVAMKEDLGKAYTVRYGELGKDKEGDEDDEDGALFEESNVLAMKEDLGKAYAVRYGELEKDKDGDEDDGDGALFEESNVLAMKEDLGKAYTVRYGELVGDEDDEDDDWEGIERSELEKVFAKAVNYVEYGGKDKDDQLTNIGSNVQIQLYGLHKLSVEGPCYEPQPMALKVSARAKWNSWQKLGSMSPELAMEQYIKLLSEADPEWAYYYHPDAGDGKGGLIPSGAAGSSNTNLTLPKELQADDEEGGRSGGKDPELRGTI